MDGNAALIIEGKQCSVAEFEGFVNEVLPCSRRAEDSAPYLACDDLYVVFAKTVQAQACVGGVNFSISLHLAVTVGGCPFCHVGMEALAIFDYRSEQAQISAFAHLTFQTPAQFIPRLGFHRNLAVRTVLRSQPGKEQADEMIDFGDGGDGALSAAATGALLNADRRGDSGDQIYVRARELLHELAGIDVHGVEEPALALGKKQIKRTGAFAGAADTCDHDELAPRYAQGKILQIVLARAADSDGIGYRSREVISLEHSLLLS